MEVSKPPSTLIHFFQMSLPRCNIFDNMQGLAVATANRAVECLIEIIAVFAVEVPAEAALVRDLSSAELTRIRVNIFRPGDILPQSKPWWWIWRAPYAMHTFCMIAPYYRAIDDDDVRTLRAPKWFFECPFLVVLSSIVPSEFPSICERVASEETLVVFAAYSHDWTLLQVWECL